jgi:FkbM family methyltransferase
MNKNNFIYFGKDYLFEYNPNDVSGLGCVYEIVTINEYILHNFVNKVDKNFIDIGANCGVATIILAKQNPLSTIYSFEPDPNLFKILLNNIEINNLKNVKVFNKAVTKKNIKQIKLSFHPDYSGGNTTYLNNLFSNGFNSIMVDCISLDEIINENAIQEIELLKIDCEGAEYDIIYDSEYFVNKIVKNMVGEFHNLKYNLVRDNAENLINYCKKFVNGIFKITTLTV